ncbi:MAG: alpha/beta hydrolase [Magnetospirillum sp.]|nr:alpha/beta hydrolase [Magnetospirillum sp.]
MVVEMLGALAGGYVLLVGGMAVFQRGMIYFPSPVRGEPAEAGLPEMVSVPVRTADGVLVASWYAPSRRPGGATVVLFHGNSGSLAHRAVKARALLDAGFGVLLAGYRGFGGNPGRPSEKGLYADARAALGWLGVRGVKAPQVALYGESLGTGVAVQMATEYAVAAVVLEAPYTRLPDLAPAVVPSGLAGMLMVDRFDNLAKIGAVQAPLLIVHGDADDVVPIGLGRRLFDAAATDKEGVFIAGGGHSDLWQRGIGATVVDFLDRRLGGAG